MSKFNRLDKVCTVHGVHISDEVYTVVEVKGGMATIRGNDECLYISLDRLCLKKDVKRLKSLQTPAEKALCAQLHAYWDEQKTRKAAQASLALLVEQAEILEAKPIFDAKAAKTVELKPKAFGAPETKTCNPEPTPKVSAGKPRRQPKN